MKRVLLLLLTTLLFNCAMTAPKGKYRIKAAETQTTPYGAWSQVRTMDAKFVGELLAIDTTLVYLQLQQGPYCIPISDVQKVRIAQYYGYTGETTALYFAGAVATPFMHGLLLIFSAPVWLITGGATAAIAPGSESWSTTGVFTSEPIPWDEVKPWARYPVGPPKELRESCPPALTPVPGRAPVPTNDPIL